MDNKTGQEGLRAAFTRAVERSAMALSLTLATLIVTSQIITPLTGYFFPTAEDHLKKNGVNPEIARLLSDHQIRVRSRDAAGIAHSYLEVPTPGGIAVREAMRSNPANAYAYSGSLLGELLNQCYVTMPDEKTTAKQFISMATGIPEKDIENLPVTDEQMRMTVVFHEFRHCDSGNSNPAPPLSEGDADDEALQVSAALYRNPELANVWVHFRAMSFEAAHDTSLYLRHRFDEANLPTQALLDPVNREARAYLHMYLAHSDAEDNYLQVAAAFQAALDNHGPQMSALARERMQLYIRAAEYFAPSAMAAAKKAPIPQAPQLNS